MPFPDRYSTWSEPGVRSPLVFQKISWNLRETPETSVGLMLFQVRTFKLKSGGTRTKIRTSRDGVTGYFLCRHHWIGVGSLDVHRDLISVWVWWDSTHEWYLQCWSPYSSPRKRSNFQTFSHSEPRTPERERGLAPVFIYIVNRPNIHLHSPAADGGTHWSLALREAEGLSLFLNSIPTEN